MALPIRLITLLSYLLSGLKWWGRTGKEGRIWPPCRCYLRMDGVCLLPVRSPDLLTAIDKCCILPDTHFAWDLEKFDHAQLHSGVVAL